jgi:hypothetical protein
MKIDNALLKRHERDEFKKRKVDSQEQRVYFLIVCEGEKTEPNYFQSFVHSLPPYTLDIEVEGKGYDPMGVVNYAVKKKDTGSKKYDSVWAVFDKDDFPNFDKAIAEGDKEHIKCAWSNEAFELWYILHFQFQNTPMSRTEYQSYIEREVKKKSNMDYTYMKNATDMHALLQKHGNQIQSIKWGKQLEANSSRPYSKCNPCTTVYRLVEELNNPNRLLIDGD